MDIQPLNGILNGIGTGDEWEHQRLLQRLISQWSGIVGPTVATHSRPLEIHNGTLQVATSAAVWAQNLSFERRRILQKLNQRADFRILRLKDIRFSTAQWHSRPGSSGAKPVDPRLQSYQQQLHWQQHPSRMPPPQDERPHALPSQSANQAFERWSQRRQQQVQQIPLCPQCQCPAPEGELQRWSVCAFCMTQRWQADKNANHPDGAEAERGWAKHEQFPEPEVAPARQEAVTSRPGQPLSLGALPLPFSMPGPGSMPVSITGSVQAGESARSLQALPRESPEERAAWVRAFQSQASPTVVRQPRNPQPQREPLGKQGSGDRSSSSPGLPTAESGHATGDIHLPSGKVKPLLKKRRK